MQWRVCLATRMLVQSTSTTTYPLCSRAAAVQWCPLYRTHAHVRVCARQQSVQCCWLCTCGIPTILCLVVSILCYASSARGIAASTRALLVATNRSTGCRPCCAVCSSAAVQWCVGAHTVRNTLRAHTLGIGLRMHSQLAPALLRSSGPPEHQPSKRVLLACHPWIWPFLGVHTTTKAEVCNTRARARRAYVRRKWRRSQIPSKQGSELSRAIRCPTPPLSLQVKWLQHVSVQAQHASYLEPIPYVLGSVGIRTRVLTRSHHCVQRSSAVCNTTRDGVPEDSTYRGMQRWLAAHTLAHTR